MTVHSIRWVPQPTDHGVTGEADERSKGVTAPQVEERSEDPVELKNYWVVDMTIIPKDAECSSVWEPGELILNSQRISSLMEMEDKEVGNTELVEIWDGANFVDDDPGKYPGAQRLKVTFAVKPGTSRAWLQYYAETVGQLELLHQQAAF